MIFVNKLFEKQYKKQSQQIGASTTFADSDDCIKSCSPAITVVGVGKNVNAKSFYDVRKSFYDLYTESKSLSVLDCGNINFENASIKKLLSKLKKHTTIFLCDTAEISASILALQQSENTSTALVVPDVTSTNIHIDKLFLKTKFDVSVIAYQKYFSDAAILNKIGERYCESMRLGEFRADNNEAEPILRDSNTLAIDLAAVRKSDGGTSDSPNGLYAEELCTIANYAGLSNNISQINIVCNNSENATTAQLAAQTAWHFADGLINRIVENPIKNKLQKFIVNMGGKETNMIFYKSPLTNRWWVKISDKNQQKFLACTLSDYQKACAKDVPVRFLLAIQKMR